MPTSKQSYAKLIFIIFFVSLGIWPLSSCSKSKKASFLIISAEKLSFDSYSCVDIKETNNSGLNTLCQESIRFSTAHTTSTQSAAAMGSILSAKYPYQHGLHRSFDRIKPHLPLLQEYFKKLDYRTSFFSSRASILKKTGLSRGFDLFEDSSFLDKSGFSLDFKSQSSLFLNWLDSDNTPFFSVLYNSDLNSLNEGEMQTSRLEKFDENLDYLFAELKKRNLWESSYIIVVGLQGRSEYNRPNETIYSNLHSENTNIALFIKPPRQKGDEGIAWKIDTPIQLADIGLSLINTISPEGPTSFDSDFPVLDFSSIWISGQSSDLISNSKEPRKILVESANTWTPKPELRFAVHFKNYLLIESTQNHVYNKITDGLETIPLSLSMSEINTSDIEKLTTIREGLNLWKNYFGPIPRLVQLNREYWATPNDRAQIFVKEELRLAKEKTAQPLSILLTYHKNPHLAKDFTYEEARMHSYNLSLENIWGLWQSP